MGAVIAIGLAEAAAPRAEAGDFLSIGDLFSKTEPATGKAEFSSGFDVSGNAWSTYASAIFALTSPLHTDGWRLKIAGVYGKYSYETRDPTVCRRLHDPRSGFRSPSLSAICDDIAGNPPQGDRRASIEATLAPSGMELEGDQIVAVTPYQALHYNIGMAPGYQATLGRLTLRAYLGIAMEQQDILPLDPGNSLAGMHWGAQGWADAWLPLGEYMWISADGGYFTGTETYSANMKFGLRPMNWLAVGPELAAFGDSEGDYGRAGGFLRFEAAGWETTLSGGLSGAYRDDPGAYGTANLFIKF